MERHHLLRFFFSSSWSWSTFDRILLCIAAATESTAIAPFVIDVHPYRHPFHEILNIWIELNRNRIYAKIFIPIEFLNFFEWHQMDGDCCCTALFSSECWTLKSIPIKFLSQSSRNSGNRLSVLLVLFVSRMMLLLLLLRNFNPIWNLSLWFSLSKMNIYFCWSLFKRLSDFWKLFYIFIL